MKIDIFKKQPKINTSKVQIILSIAIAWTVPIAVIIFYSYYSFQIDMKSSVNNNFVKTIQFSLNIPIERIDQVIAQSRKATIDKYIEEQNRSYEKGIINEEILYSEITKYIVRTYYRQKEINMVSIELLESDHVFYNDLGKYLDYLQYTNKARDDIFAKSENIDTYIGFHTDEFGNLYIFRNMFVSDSGSRRKIGTIVFRLDTDYIFQEIKDNMKDTESIIVSLNDSILHLLDKDREFKKINLSLLGQSGFANSDIYTSFSDTIKTSDYMLRYSIIADNLVLYKELDDFKRNIIGLSVLIVPLIIMISNILYKKMTKPLKVLSDGINELELGKLGLQIDATEKNDFNYLFNAFNSMSNQLYFLFEKVYKEEVIAKDAKIMSLRAQINPHFLNNTLELMNWQARMGDNESVVKMIEALSIMIDAALNREDKMTSPLYKEIEYCDAYLYVISQRYKDRIKIIKDIDEELLMNKVPSLIIQPFLENAVKHGIEPAGEGYIKLEIRKEKDFIIIEVSNDGKRISDDDKEKIDRLLNHDDFAYSLGIRNVNERLKLMFGQDDYITIKDIESITIAQIKVPK